MVIKKIKLIYKFLEILCQGHNRDMCYFLTNQEIIDKGVNLNKNFF